MRVGGGKQKGSAYERDICRRFSLWISYNKNENLLWRSAMSGGRSTIAGQKGRLNKEQAGDISAVGEDGHKLIEHFYIECKSYKDLGIAKFMLYQPSKLKDFWEKALTNATKINKVPLLIAKQNYFPELVITTPDIWSFISLVSHNISLPITHCVHKNLQVFLLDDLLSKCKLDENLKNLNNLKEAKDNPNDPA